MLKPEGKVHFFQIVFNWSTDLNIPTTKNIHQTDYLTPWSRALLDKLIVCSASQEIHHLLWNLKVHYCVRKSLLDIRVLFATQQNNNAPIFYCGTAQDVFFTHTLPLQQ
jgi:hypothetical protein